MISSSFVPDAKFSSVSSITSEQRTADASKDIKKLATIILINWKKFQVTVQRFSGDVYVTRWKCTCDKGTRCSDTTVAPSDWLATYTCYGEVLRNGNRSRVNWGHFVHFVMNRTIYKMRTQIGFKIQTLLLTRLFQL